MKRWLSLVMVVILCLALVIGIACGGGEEEEEGVTEIKMGAGVPLSGVLGAVVGIPAKRGIELATDRIGVFEVGGKQCRWEAIFEDNQGGSAAGGVASTTKFIFDYGVDFVVQSGAAGLAAQALCEESGVILDPGVGELKIYGPDHPYSTQSGPCVVTHLACFYDWLAKEHPEVKKIVVAASTDPLLAAYNEAYDSNMHEYFGFEQDIVWIPEGTTEYYPVATSVMALDPDLVVSRTSTQVMDILWEMGYDGLAAGYGPILSQGLLEQKGWDKCKGMIFCCPEWFGAEEVWPEAVAIGREYEARHGEEMGSTTFWALTCMYTLTGVLQAAGTVDVEKIMEVIHGGMTFDSIVGPIYYGGEGLVGINCIVMWPVAIWEVVGEREYELVAYYTPEEAEALGVEVWTAAMP